MIRACIAAAIFALIPVSLRADDAAAVADEAAPVVANPLLVAPRPATIPQPPPEELQAAIDRGIAFLLADQNPDGSWGSAERTKDLNIYAPVPGSHHAFRTAVTAMCVTALIETKSESEEVTASLERGEEWLVANAPRLRRATPDAIYNVWGHCYAISAFAHMIDRRPADDARRAEFLDLIAQQVQLLERYESVDGGWGYYDFRAGAQRPTSSSTSFQTAAVLVAWKEAERLGVAIPEKPLQRAIDSIHRQRKPDFSYIYGEYLKMSPMMPINRPGGSVGRSQSCNAALRIWGDEAITDEVLRAWLDRLFTRGGWLDIGRKRPVPHESWFQVAGYFYYFGHYYGALAIELLPPDQRAEYQDHLAATLMQRQEKDGSWWDYPLYNYHQQYGTAFGLMTLVRCQR